MLIPCVQPECEPLKDELRAATRAVHADASQKRASGLSTRSLQPLTATSRRPPMMRIAQKSWSSCSKPPSSSSHTLPAYLRNARIVRCGEHVQVSRGLRAGSSSKGCSPDVIPRCVVARRRSSRDISLTSSVRRADLRQFTRRSGRRYLLFSNALCDLDRVLMGSWRRSVTVTPSYRHGRAVPPPAVKGTTRLDGRGHLAVPK